ncbi:MAG TPA: helix-turn-helix transcriptional regulator [Bacillota bacterium]|jgi:DNA-binding XRE family transcriptional regulator|nr:helix-turn-helix transcriptional regulator [Fastidiosipila sp.]HPX92888.1 helix-turn-helix transcriptional regulator [Bacillota bacterium]HQB80722.1 helix-turn-helix transcriptional regulator [Bacillota bacterium]
MSFEKIIVKDLVAEKRKDPNFDKAYAKIEQEYSLIDKIVQERKRKKITQEKLAAMTGISQQSISRLEREKHIPQIDTLMKLLDGLDLKLTIVSK